MALSMLLGQSGYTPKSIETKAEVSLDKKAEGYAITNVALVSQIELPGIDTSTFDKIIQKAKAGCPVSQLLNTTITLDYQLKA